MLHTCLSKCDTGLKNKIFPKSIQNLPKMLSKSSQNPPRSLPEPPFKTEREKKSIFFYFFQFLEGLGPPKIEPKSRKIEKKTEKIEIKKPHVFLIPFVSNFLYLYASDRRLGISCHHCTPRNLTLMRSTTVSNM